MRVEESILGEAVHYVLSKLYWKILNCCKSDQSRVDSSRIRSRRVKLRQLNIT